MTPDFQTDLALLLAYLERQYVPPAERDAMRRIQGTIERARHLEQQEEIRLVLDANHDAIFAQGRDAA